MSASTARRPKRRPARGPSMTVIVMFGIAGALLLKVVIDHLAVTLTILGVAATVTGLLWGRRRSALRQTRARDLRELWRIDPLSLGPGQFEHYLAGLCERDGCTQVTVVGGAGDLAADVLYTDPSGRRGMIQAKRYQPGNTVGSEHVQRVNGTYQYHGCQHASIVTTSTFTAAARSFAHDVGIRLLEHRCLAAWAAGQPGAAPWN